MFICKIQRTEFLSVKRRQTNKPTTTSRKPKWNTSGTRMLILYSLYVSHVCSYFVKMEQRKVCILLNRTVLRNITFNRRLFVFSLFSHEQTVKMAVMPCNIFVQV